MVLQNGWSFCQWLFMTLLDNFEYAGPSCSWILTCCLDFSLILLRIISKIIGANDGNRCQNILTILLRHLIWNWSCPTGWNCRKFFFLFFYALQTLLGRGWNQALPLLPGPIFSAYYVKEVSKHQENTKLSKYSAVQFTSFVFSWCFETFLT